MLRKTLYQMQYRLMNLLPNFHKGQVKNLIAMVVGMAAGESVNLPQVARYAPIEKIQVEGRVQRFERLIQCPKFVPLAVLQPVARQILSHLWKRNRSILVIMDRSLINDTLNLLHVAVGYGGRALPLGWFPHEGSSDFKLQKKIMGGEVPATRLSAGGGPGISFDSFGALGRAKAALGLHFTNQDRYVGERR